MIPFLLNFKIGKVNRFTMTGHKVVVLGGWVTGIDWKVTEGPFKQGRQILGIYRPMDYAIYEFVKTVLSQFVLHWI